MESNNVMTEPGNSSTATGVRTITVERAIELATAAHSGQTDKAGAPYILHPLRVMLAVKTDAERRVAVMHDVLEDCPWWSLTRLRREGFSDAELAALLALTRRKGEVYDAFIERVAANPLAVEVKLADLADNMDLSRLDEITPADVERAAKYRRAELRLQVARMCANSADTSDVGDEVPGTKQ